MLKKGNICKLLLDVFSLESIYVSISKGKLLHLTEPGQNKVHLAIHNDICACYTLHSGMFLFVCNSCSLYGLDGIEWRSSCASYRS